MRAGQTITVETAASVDAADGKRKLGVWVRDSTAGVGTLTYVDPQTGAYGALGHAIVDADTGKLLDAREGAILRANIVGVAKGQSGKAGELKGNFLKEGRQIGSLLENCEYGIYGVMRDAPRSALYPEGHERQPDFAGWSDHRRGDARLPERRDAGIRHVYRVDARKKRRAGCRGAGSVNVQGKVTAE